LTVKIGKGYITAFQANKIPNWNLDIWQLTFSTSVLNRKCQQNNHWVYLKHPTLFKTDDTFQNRQHFFEQHHENVTTEIETKISRHLTFHISNKRVKPEVSEQPTLFETTSWNVKHSA
jgi:hypothetical protein